MHGKAWSMSYHVVDPDELDPEPDRPSDTRDIRKAVGLENMGLRVYHVAPGEDIPLSGLHYHDEQEEVFYPVDGALQVETPETTYTVPRGQVFVAAPGSPHRAFNAPDAADTVTVLAIGAPGVADGHAYES